MTVGSSRNITFERWSQIAICFQEFSVCFQFCLLPPWSWSCINQDSSTPGVGAPLPFTTCCWLRNQITRLSGNSAMSAWDATPGPVLGPLACFPSTSFFHPSSTKGFAGFLLFPWHLHQTLFSPAAVPFPSLARNTLGYFFPVSHGQYKTSSLLLWEFLLLFALRKYRVAYKHKKSQQI